MVSRKEINSTRKYRRNLTNSTGQQLEMEMKNKEREMKALKKDFNVYTKLYHPESRELLRKFRKNETTRGWKEHVEVIVYMLKLEIVIMKEKQTEAERGFPHTCRDVIEWVRGMNKSFSSTPSASIIRDWVHGRVKHKKPFPALVQTVGSEEDTGDEEDGESD